MYPDAQAQNIAKIKKISIAIVVAAIVAYITVFIVTHGFVSITVSGPDSSEYTVQLLDQKSNTTQTFASKTKEMKRFVKKSSYEITVSTSNSGGWTQTETGGLLSTTQQKVTTDFERKRTFVADQPKGCMAFDQVLVTIDCDVNSDSLTIHLPGSQDVPPSVQTNTDGVIGGVIGVASTASGTVGLVQKETEDEDSTGYIYSLLSIKVPFAYSGQTVINVADDNAIYKIASYRDGVIVYSDSFSDITYYPAIGAPAEKIKAPTIPSGYNPYKLNVTGGTISLSYSNQDPEDDTSQDKVSKDIASLVYVVDQNGTTRNYSLKGFWSNILLCQDTIICAVSAVGEKQQVSVYKINGSALDQLYSVNNVSQVAFTTAGLLIVNDKNILRLNPATRSAVVDYSLGKFSYCGSGSSQLPASYIICVADQTGSHALLVEAGSPSAISVDKVLLDLTASKSVESVTIDRNTVYITPNYGEDVFNEAEGYFGYDPKTQAAADATIESLVVKSKLRENSYNVLNLLSGGL